ncbi:MFS transporter [Flexivirga oryzae]|uniref:MFS family permease n=1 Tax=Flexivirga oryzae TaxID=1794944 RepID=A0A839NCF6_9MICO|nr:MFS transporter [Flexivirga oryzae]MBB2892252.1 MFS family permease [Flexivirga oryzae]
MTSDGLSGRKRRRAERDRAFTEPVQRPSRTRPLPPQSPGGRRPPPGTSPRDPWAAQRGPQVRHTPAPEDEHEPDDSGTEQGGRSTARAAGRGMVRGAGAMARLTATASKKTVYAARRASEAQGAGESGLARLIQVHAFNSAGDAAVTIGLAGTVFFSVSSAQAKGQVLLFLCLTMLPFAIVAPLIGPLLDRFRHGRRWAIGFTLAIRAFLCWVLAEAIDDNSVWLFPVALCVLIASKAYLVTRSAAAPRLLPDQLTLVKANGRLSLAGVVGAGVAGALAGGAAKLGGAAWGLRVGALLFAIGTVLAILLPPRVDSSIGEKPAPSGLTTGRATGRGVGPAVVTALRANTGLRWLSGFLTIFLAFLVRSHPFPGWQGKETLLLALVLGAAGVGNSVGTVAGAALKIASPKVVVLATLVADAVMVVIAAAHFTVVTATAVGFVAGLGQQLGKLSLDSQIQDTVPEHMRTSVFGRSETLLQLAWVIGGIIAVAIPTNASLGMILAAVVLVAWASVVLIWNSGHSLPVPHRARSGKAPAAEPPEKVRRPQPHPSGYDEAETIGLRRSDVPRKPPPGSADRQRPRREQRPGGWR